jgi:hypothetical protein
VVVLLLLAVGGSRGLGQVPPGTGDIAAQWRYFCPLVVRCQAYDIVIEVRVDFSRLLAEAKAPGVFDKNSIRVVELGAPETSGAEEPSVFIPDADFDAATRARGRLRFRVRTGAPERAFRVYLDTLENSEKPLVAYGEEFGDVNRVANASFERMEKDGKLPAGWDLLKRTGGALDGAGGHSGARAVRLRAPEKGQVASLGIPGAAPLNVEPGEKYLLRFWTKAHNLSDHPMVVSAYWYDDSRKYVYHERLEQVDQVSWEWKESECVLNAPPVASGLRIYVATQSTSGNLWVDDVFLVPARPLELKHLQRVSPPAPAQEAPPPQNGGAPP